MPAKLIAIAYKTQRNGDMIEATQANVTLCHGVENDVFGKPSQRQVTVLSKQQWQQACAEINQDLEWIHRRANLLVDGLSFNECHKGQRLQIGELVLEITGETDPCKKMQKAHIDLEAALTPNWRGGATCKVIKAALIKLNDEVQLLP